jgi:hypothetical protein
MPFQRPRFKKVLRSAYYWTHLKACSRCNCHGPAQTDRFGTPFRKILAKLQYEYDCFRSHQSKPLQLEVVMPTRLKALVLKILSRYDIGMSKRLYRLSHNFMVIHNKKV